MLLQLSLEILLSMSVSIMLAGIGYSMYLHLQGPSTLASNTITHLANLSAYYSGSLYNACRCS